MDSRFAWAVLGSSWAHIVLLLALMMVRARETEPPPVIVEVVTVDREAPSPVKVDLPEAVPPEPPEARPEVEREEPEAEPEPEIEGSPAVVETVAGAIAAANAAARAASASAAALLGFPPPPPPELAARERQDLPRVQPLTPPPSARQAAIPPERLPPAVSADVAPPAQQEQQRPVDSEEPQPEVARDTVTPPPKPPEPEPPPEPEEEEVVRRFVRAPDGEDADVQSELMSSVSRAATQRASRTPVTSPIVGPVPSPVDAPTTAEAHAIQQTAAGGASQAKVDEPEEATEPAREQRAGGGGHTGADGTDRAAPGERGELVSTPGSRATSLATLAMASQGSAGTARPLPSADDGFEVPMAVGAPAPSWWQPSASRIEIVDPVRDPARHQPTEVVVASPKRKPEPVVTPGGSEAVEELSVEEEPLPGVEAAELALVPADDPYARAAQEPIEALREALGWGKLDRSSLAREGSQGNEASTGLPPGSPQTVTKEDPLANVVFISVEATPLGRYTDDVYSILEDRWYTLDLDPNDKALGIQGDVGVVFRIGRNGKVYGIEVTRSSGNRTLDRMATSAIPEQLPRFPRDVEASSVVQHVTFQYRNPWMSSSSVGMP